MAEAIGVASGIASLVTIVAQISKYAFKYASDVAHASQIQRAYIGEVIALAEVLDRIRDSSAQLDNLRIEDLSSTVPLQDTIERCHALLETQRSRFEKPTSKFLWPFQDRETRKSIDELHRYRGIFADCLSASTSRIASTTLQNINSMRADQQKQRLLHDLKNDHYLPKQHPSPLAGTGSWLLERVEFKQWLSGAASPFLWCYGPPGVGKSCLSLIVRQHVLGSAKTSNVRVAAIFANHRTHQDQTDAVIFCDILRQIAKQADDDEIVWMSTQEPAIATGMNVDEAVGTLVKFQQHFRRKLILIIDALDELQDSRNLVSHLHKLQALNTFVFLTSRDQSNSDTLQKAVFKLKISASNQDLTLYVRTRFDSSDFAHMAGNLDSVIERVTRIADGLFLLAKLIVDQLLELPNIRKMKRMLDESPRNLSEAFESTMSRIDAQPTEMRQLAHRLIGWIIHVQRPLHVSEIQEAFAIEPGDETVDPDGCTDLSILLRITIGLVIVEPEQDTLALVHLSAYEFFLARAQFESDVINRDIADTCSIYLSLKELKSGPCNDLTSLEARLKALPFLQYASKHWGAHFAAAMHQIELENSVRMLLEDDKLRSSSFQALHFRDTVQSRDLRLAIFASLPCQQNPLHVTAYWGLLQLTEAFLIDGHRVDATDSQGWTPLHWAASNGHRTVAEILLREGADVNSADSRGWTPLFWASLRDQISCITLLLTKGADIDHIDLNGWTALRWAAATENAMVARTLVLAKAQQVKNINTHPERDQLLQSEIFTKIAKIEQVDDATRTFPTGEFELLKEPLHDDGAAAERNKWQTVWDFGHLNPPTSNMWRVLNKMERHNGVHPSIRNQYENPSPSESAQADRWKSKMLCRAIQNDQLDVVRLLIESGVTVNHAEGRTPLHVAAYRSDPFYTQMLVLKGANVEAEDMYGQTALHQAVLNGFELTVEALLSAGSNPNAKREKQKDDLWVRASMTGTWGTSGGQTPLMLAFGLRADTDEERVSQERILALLLQYGADVTVCDHDGKSCLHYALLARNATFAEQFLKRGAIVNCRDQHGLKPIHVAAISGDPRTITLLLSRGADASVVDDYGRNTMHYLAACDRKDAHLSEWKHLVDLLVLKVSTDALQTDYDVLPPRKGSWSSDTHWQVPRHTALSHAVQNGNWHLYHILAAQGATLPTETTALLVPAIAAGQADIVRLLVERGAVLNSDIVRNILYSTEKLVLLQSSVLDVTGLKSIITSLSSLKLWDDLEENSEKQSASNKMLEVAAQKTDSVDLAMLLVRHGANPKRTVYGVDYFLQAALRNNCKSLLGLVRATKDYPGKSNHWSQRIDIAGLDSSNVLRKVSKALTECNQLETILKEDSKTILRLAIDNKNEEFARHLLLDGASANVTDEHGWTLLHWAVLLECVATIQALIEIGHADVNARSTTWAEGGGPRPSGLYRRSSWRGTPLHIASMVGNVEITNILLKHGADVTIENMEREKGHYHFTLHGPTALQIALGSGQTYGIQVANLGTERLTIARMLLDHGAAVDKEIAASLRDDLAAHFTETSFQDVWQRIKDTQVLSPT